jgi:hypothetical protein
LLHAALRAFSERHFDEYERALRQHHNTPRTATRRIHQEPIMIHDEENFAPPDGYTHALELRAASGPALTAAEALEAFEQRHRTERLRALDAEY